MKPLSDLDVKELLEALAAHRMGWWPADSVSFAVTVWVSGGEGPRAAMSAVLTATQVRAASAAAAAALEARGGDAITAMGDLCADAMMARDLLVLPLPADWAKSLRVVVDKSKREAAARASEVPREMPSTLSRDVTSTVVIGPASVDRYTMGKEIGRGGLGSVVEAHDNALNRDVAIKLALDNMPGDQQSRFVREVELTARLEHPNIVPVHDFGVIKTTGGGRHMFLCMKRIRGRDLGMLLKDLARGDAATVATTSRARLLAIFQDVCQGVGFAHSRGVIHRDLKPANVMLGEFGETLIVDWGIAKVKGETLAPAPAVPRATRSVRPDDPSATVVLQSDDTSLTLEGDIVGTPSYMSPEQAAGRLVDVDERSDIWSLGVILYELLTNALPFDGMSTGEVLNMVRAGTFLPPSKRLLEAPVPEASRPCFPPVPPELDAIVQRAMTVRRDDRFASALDLHREVQLFLEGASDLERRRKQAATWEGRGRKRLERFRALHEEVVKAAAQVRELESSVKLHEPIEAKRPYREAKARLAALQEERVEAFSAAASDFGHALAVDASMDAAAAGLCELHFDWFLESERDKNDEDMLFHRRALEVYDRTGEFREKLDAPGKLSIRALAWECDCLAPKTNWSVAFEEEPTLMWSDGLTRPGEAIKDWAQPVPKAKCPGKFGHTEKCATRVVGAKVTAARYEEKDGLLVAGAPRDLGATPLAGVELEPGSWLCTITPADAALAPVRLPVRIERAIEWSQDVRLLPAARIPAGFVQVPGGPFIHSGPEGGGGPEEARTCADFLIAKFPVTSGEYLEFLNDLASRDPVDVVAQRAPRGSTGSVWPNDGKRFRLPAVVPGGKTPWAPDLPVLMVSWYDALTYCAWRSTRDGRLYTLPHEVQFEKAARGVDARVFPFGNVYDGTFANTNSSFGDGFRLLPVGSMPADESPYGARDLAGNMGTWCLNSIAGPFAAVREYKGGAWDDVWHHARSPSRMGSAPRTGSLNIGLRLAMPVYAYSP